VKHPPICVPMQLVLVQVYLIGAPQAVQIDTVIYARHKRLHNLDFNVAYFDVKINIKTNISIRIKLIVIPINQ